MTSTNINNYDFSFMKDKDIIHVFYLEAPLGLLKLFPQLEQSRHPFLEVDGYHTGVGFMSDTYKFHVEYVALNFAHCLYPTIISEGGDTTSSLKWEEAQINVGTFSDNYWVHSTYICTITKDQFNKYLHYVKTEYIVKNHTYILFDVIKSNNTIDLFNPLLSGSTCDNFSFWTFKFLSKKLGAVINYPTRPKITLSNLVTSEPVLKLDEEKDKHRIIDFYKSLEQSFLFIYNKIKKYNNTDPSASCTTINNQGDVTDDDYNLIRNIISNVYAMKQIAGMLYNEFTHPIYYGYGPNNKLGYYQLSSVRPLLTYIIYPLPTKQYKNPTTIKNIPDNRNESLDYEFIKSRDTIIASLAVIFVAVIIIAAIFVVVKYIK